MSIGSDTQFNPLLDPSNPDFFLNDGDVSNGTNNTGTPFAGDTISDSEITGMFEGPQRISLLDAQLSVGLAKILFDSVCDESSTFNATAHTDLYLALAIEASSHSSIFGSIIFLSERIDRTIENNNQNIIDARPAVADYNNNLLPADNKAISEVNTAIQAYNDGTISEAEYQAAVQKYNDYVSSRNSSAAYTAFTDAANTFNNEVETTNASIDSINTDLLTAEIDPPIEHQNTIDLKGMPVIDTAGTPPNLSTLTTLTPAVVTFNTYPPQGYNRRIDQYLGTLLDQIEIDGFLDGAGYCYSNYCWNFGNIFASSSERLHNYLQTMLIVAYTALPELFFTPNLNSDDGIDASLKVGFLQRYSLEVTARLLYSTACIASIKTFRNIIALNSSLFLLSLRSAVLAIHYSNLSCMSKLCLASGLGAITLFKGLIIQPFNLTNRAVRVIIGLAIISEFKNAVISGLLLSTSRNTLSQIFRISTLDLIERMSFPLATINELSFLLIGLAQMCQALGNLTLFGSALALLEAGSLLGLANPALSFADILQTDGLTSHLISSLAVSQGLMLTVSIGAALEFVSAAIAATLLLGVYLTKDNFASLLSVQLISEGLIDSDALTLAIFVSCYVEAEIIGAALLDNPLTAEFLAQGLMANALISSLVANNTFSTVRDLRDALAFVLAKDGEITLAQAFIAATLLIAEALPLVNTMTEEEFRTALTAAVTTALQEGGITDTESFVKEIVDAIMGSGDGSTDQPSLFDLINEKLTTLSDLNDPEITQAIVDAIKDLLSNPAALWMIGTTLQTGAFSFLDIAYNNQDANPLSLDNFNLQA